MTVTRPFRIQRPTLSELVAYNYIDERFSA